MNDLVVKHFEGHPVRFRLDNGQMVLTMEEAGKLYGYANPRDGVSNLLKLHRDEFDSDCTHMLVMSVADVHRPPLHERVFTLEGLLLLGMFCELPNAKRVRHWLRKIGKQVLVEGYYVAPGLEQSVLARMGETLRITNTALQLLGNRLDNLETRLLIPAHQDVTDWLTAGLRVRELIAPDKPPKFWNSGGAFDKYAAEEYHRIHGEYPRLRPRTRLKKDPEWVFPPTPEMDRFLLETYKRYLKFYWPTKQQKLNLRVV
jgi:prophage antirepressor-like protein